VAFAQRADPADFAALAPRIVASADPAAEAVLSVADADVAGAIGVLQQGSGLPVVFLGGLGAHYAARLRDQWKIREPLGSGLDGALWIARTES
jgi:glucosamine kinase